MYHAVSTAGNAIFVASDLTGLCFTFTSTFNEREREREREFATSLEVMKDLQFKYLSSILFMHSRIS